MSEDCTEPRCPGPTGWGSPDTGSCAGPTDLAHPDVAGAGGVVCAHLGYQAAIQTVRDMRDVTLRDFLS